MPVIALGLNHQSAPLDIRERAVIPADDLEAAMARLAGLPSLHEAAVLSTCNRLEVYAVVDDAQQGDAIQQWLEQERDLPSGWMTPHLYRLSGPDAVQHLLRVAAGLDSLVLGEPQILGQAKLAYRSAAQAGLLGQILDRLFQHAFAVSKRVRHETAIGAHPVSVPYAAVTLARQIFGDLSALRTLLIGAGEMIELVARHFHEQGMRQITIANRSAAPARAIAAECHGQTIPLESIGDHLPQADIVVACTGSDTPIVSHDIVARALRDRRYQPIFMVDLAVPRDIEPRTEQLRDVYLYTVDDLRDVIDRNIRSRAAAAAEGEALVAEQSARFMDWIHTLAAVESIRHFRHRGERLRDMELARANRELASGQPPEAVIDALARRLTRKLLHAPTIGLRDAARDGESDTLEKARQTLGLDNDDDRSGS